MKQLLRRNVCDGQFAEVSAKEFEKPTLLFQRGLRKALPALLLDQLLGDGCKAVARTNACLDTGLSFCCIGSTACANCLRAASRAVRASPA